MENNNLPVIAKRIWSIMRVLYFMLRKKISQRKLMVDLYLKMKRGKIVGKTLGNLITVSSFSHRRSDERHVSDNAPRDYEFSCGNNSPMFPFQLTKRNKHSHFFACAHAPPPVEEEGGEVVTINAVKRVLEMLNVNDQMMSVEASPALSGFERHLRVTDSPYPLNSVNDDDHSVDKSAEDFIVKFYNDLRKQDHAMSPKPW